MASFAPVHHAPLLLLCLVYSLQMMVMVMIMTSGTTAAFPLFTNSRWIVDGGGRRVKLACANWPSHLEGMLAEGLGKQPLDDISKKIAAMGFNCVRLTWPTFMFTNESLGRLTVRQSFQALNLVESIGGIVVNNPAFVDLTLIQAYKSVVTNLGENNIMVILDNHISKPGWCCSNTDGNGFFGDTYFDPDVWIQGLTNVATTFNGFKAVVGMSLRNELRGPRQNSVDWFKYMQKGAEAVHAANPDVLVVLSGLSFDNDLSFLAHKTVQLTFERKLVFELHWYGFSDGSSWKNGNANDVCGRITASVKRRAGFLLEQGWPLFVSEFGKDQRGGNVNDNRYFGCIMAVLADWDADWAIWTLQGSYYLRQGVYDLEEVYGMLSWDWSRPRNATYLRTVQSVQQPFRGPGVSDFPPSLVIFNPLTGFCIVRTQLGSNQLELGACHESNGWNYTAGKTLEMKGTDVCLTALGDGRRVQLGSCDCPSSKWDLISQSRMHLSTTTTAASSGSNNASTVVCLDVGTDGRSIVTVPCRCLSGDMNCDPESQWFKLVTSTRAISEGSTVN